MRIKLPQSFTDKMKTLLGSEYNTFLASYEQPRKYGLRVNALKLTGEAFTRLSPFGARLEPIAWADGGFYYEENDRPGKHPHYHAGLYYIQEPSAMVPAELLGVLPGDRVLDLCAAPGGKSTQLAAKLQGRGVLVANDNAKERTKALAKNIELAGVRNAVVLNEEPSALAGAFEGWFDRILVDAPCSGEGMFRKDESMIAEWERHSVQRCSAMQRDILRHAVRMLAPGGTLVYSTCTFSPEENEAQIAGLLSAHPEMEIVPVSLAYGWSPGRPEWGQEVCQRENAECAETVERFLPPEFEALSGTVRLWPHLTKGEGHYAAVLRKRSENSHLADKPLRDDEGGVSNPASRDGSERSDPGRKDWRERKARARQTEFGRSERAINASAEDHRRGSKESRSERLQRRTNGTGAGTGGDAVQAWRRFAADNLVGAEHWPGEPVAFGSRVYVQPAGLPSLAGLRVVRAGWYVGDAGPHRFEPSQPLAMGLRPEEAALVLKLRADEEATVRFLKGETLFINDERLERSPQTGFGTAGHESKTQEKALSTTGQSAAKGSVLVCADGFPIGWGKVGGDGLFKNELPPGWRLI